LPFKAIAMMDEIWVTPVAVEKEEAFDWMAMPSNGTWLTFLGWGCMLGYPDRNRLPQRQWRQLVLRRQNSGCPLSVALLLVIRHERSLLVYLDLPLFLKDCRVGVIWYAQQ
jgi:hypothetical protein